MAGLEQNAATAPDEVGASAANAEELLDLVRRERANFLNYKRRVEQERAVDYERAQAERLLRLLPVLDDLDRALAKRPPDLQDHPWAIGVELVHRRLLDALESLGVERFGAPGEEFDPSRHDAVLYEGTPDASEQVVKEVLRPGYQMHGRLLRPAQVSVAAVPDTGGPNGAAAARPHRRRPHTDEAGRQDNHKGA